MRILQIIGEPTGGIRRHVHSVINGLYERDEKCFYVFSHKGHDEAFIYDLSCFVKNGIENLEIKMHKAPAFNDLSNLYKIYNFCKKNKIDVVHAHSAKAGVYARLLSIFLGVHIIYTPHGGVLHDAFGKITSSIYLFVERLLMSLTDVLIFESEYSKNAYLNKVVTPSCKYIVNYNGVVDVRETLLNENKYFVYDDEFYHYGVFARLHPLKGQELAIQAINYLNSNKMLPKKAILHLFGDGDDKERLKCICHSLGSNYGDVIFHGDVKNPEIYMLDLDAVFIPSTFESFSYVAAEAMMLGVPVIASNVGGLKEVLAEGSGLLFDNLNYRFLADEILKLNSDCAMRTKMVNQAKARCSELFSQKIMVNNLIEEYEKLVNAQ